MFKNLYLKVNLHQQHIKKLTKELEKIITDDDHVAIYYSYNSKMIKKQEIGKSIDKTCFIID